MRYFLLIAIWLLFVAAAHLAAQSNTCPLSDAQIEQARQGWGSGKQNRNFNCRSDSADILHYHIELDLMNTAKAYLKGNCTVSFTPLIEGLQQLTLDLLLRVDSALYDGKRLSFSKQGEQVLLRFPDPLPAGQPRTVRLYYQGTPPVGDWNGFQFVDDMVYNVGSSFDANPLSYGRVWYPCFENFRERATYSFLIKTKAPKIAQCNGYLVERTTRKDTILSHWRLDNTIPSYLAAIAVADYIIQRDTFVGARHRVPIEIAAVAADTAAVRKGFRHLHYAIGTMEHWFGDYAWNKVGYSVVPALSGAMEHATNTAFSRDLLKSPATAEEYMIHELAHSWFGNQITCETGEDMWINEGLATYSEALFYERTYGRERMKRSLRQWAEEVLPYNAQDTFFPPLSGALHQYVYDGRYVYNRGALIGHTLRAYLGDQLFAQAMQTVMQTYRYQPINSVQLRDALTQATQTDLSPFFNDWVFSGGYLNVVVDSLRYRDGKTTVYLHQELLGRTRYYQQVPLRLDLLNDKQEQLTQYITLSPDTRSIEIQTPIQPRLAVINSDWALFLAQHQTQQQTDSTALFYQLPYINQLKMSTAAPLTLLCNYHYTPPTGQLPQGYRCSAYGYWELQWATQDPNAAAAARFEFSAASQSDLLDAKSTKKHPVLLYRPHTNAAWTVCPDTKIRYTNREKRSGYLDYPNAPQGWYAIGIQQ